MKISEGIASYVEHKNAKGVEFTAGVRYLLRLCRRLHDIEMEDIKSKQVLEFLDDSKGQVETWRMKYYVLTRFLDFWAARGEISYIRLPPPKPRVRQIFVPYIYSKLELRSLLSIKDSQLKTSLDQITVRTFLLLLYASGVMVGEALGLSTDDIDLKARTITIRSKNPLRRRKIPISRDLCRIFQIYLAWRRKRQYLDSHLFVKRNGRPASSELFERSFNKLRKLANVSRETSATYQPRLYDLKFTFAVHRIASWIRNGTDLNRMLPALAAYMGQKLVSTERYFLLTPERFKKQLNKLSPQGHRSHWRDNKELVVFLSGL
jgi:integrase/recombinase XerD